MDFGAQVVAHLMLVWFFGCADFQTQGMDSGVEEPSVWCFGCADFRTQKMNRGVKEPYVRCYTAPQKVKRHDDLKSCLHALERYSDTQVARCRPRMRFVEKPEQPVGE